MKDKKIAILGYGIEGKSTYDYLKNSGYENIWILDEKKIDEDIENKIEGVKIWHHLDDFDLIFRTPSISPLKKIGTRQLKDFPITSNIEEFLEHCPAKVIGVTGTKGKGTTTSLIQAIIKASGKNCFLGGNIGTPPLDFFTDIKKEDYCVLEISSFQAMTIKKSPEIAVILMVTSDHLDYHQDIDEYLDAKAEMLKHDNKICIYNFAFLNSVKIAHSSKGKLIPFDADNQDSVSYFENDKLYYRGKFLMNASEIALIGMHNRQNILAAMKVAEQLDIEASAVKQALQNFSGLPLRLEKVAVKDQMSFYNDSFSTTPETTIAALESFPDQDVYVLIGGSEKNSNFQDLINLICNSPKIHPFLFGDTGRRIQSESKDQNLFYNFDFQETFLAALNQLQKNKAGILLLSPASASFDQFSSYKERGMKFNELVEKYCC